MKKNRRKVLLIGVGNFDIEGNKIGEDSSHRSSWPHLGILVVGTKISQLGFEVILYDENVMGPVKLEKVLRVGDIVGLSVVITSVERGLDLADKAKGLGAQYVFMGNDQATARAWHILKKYPSVDGIFLGDDLTAVGKIFEEILRLNQLPQNAVPGFARRIDNEVRIAPSIPSQDLRIPIPDFSLFPMEYWNRVWGNHRLLNGFEYKNQALSEIRNSTVVLASGCTHGKNGCHYCAINEVARLRWANEQYYSSLFDDYNKFGINSFFNVTDDFSSFGKVIEKLLEAGIQFPHLTTYARSWIGAHRPRNIERMLKLVHPQGHLKLNIGLDSGNDRTLRRGINKGHGVEENRQMVLLLKALGIWAHFSFIFGSPGETQKTCYQTLEFVQWTFDTLGPLITNCESDIWWINHGAPCDRIFYDYNSACYYATLADKDLTWRDWAKEFQAFADTIIIPWQVQVSWYEHFTNIDVGFAEECNTKVREIAEKNHTNSGRAYGGLIT